MSLQKLEEDLRIGLILVMSWLNNNLSRAFGYPMFSSGMVIQNPNSDLSKLKNHMVRTPPMANPNSVIEAIFGNIPRPSTIMKVWIPSLEKGNYDFYIPHFRNIIFLPDWLSQWIQYTFDIGIDTTTLEVIRDTLFSLCVYLLFLVQVRTSIYFIITINPYTRPWIYLVSLTDWMYDLLFKFGISKRLVFLGFPVMPILVNGLLGAMADSFNHIVFTMPWCPSDAKPGIVLVNKRPQRVLRYSHPPSSCKIENPLFDVIKLFD